VPRKNPKKALKQNEVVLDATKISSRQFPHDIIPVIWVVCKKYWINIHHTHWNEIKMVKYFGQIYIYILQFNYRKTSKNRWKREILLLRENSIHNDHNVIMNWIQMMKAYHSYMELTGFPSKESTPFSVCCMLS
jgi:hypothetical protein